MARDDDDRRAFETARQMTGGSMLTRNAERYPDKAAFVEEGREIPYGQLDERIHQVARSLADLGVGHGDRVALLMGNAMPTVEVYFGCFRIGAIGVPVNLRFVAAEVAYVLANSGSKVLVVDETFAETAAAAAAQVPELERIVVVGSTEAAGPGALSWDEVTGSASRSPFGAVVDEGDPATIMYTSGTTGRPKGAVLTHKNLSMAALSALIEQKISKSDEVWYLNLPLFHISGLSAIFPYMTIGGTCVIAQLGAFDARKALDDLERYQVTAACFVGPQWQDILALPDVGSRRYALRRVIWGTSQAIVPLIEAIHDTFTEAEIFNCFGQTEMSPTTCMLHAEFFEQKKGSVGKPLINVEARIVDDDMDDVKQGEVGEIVYRGPTVMKEYWEMPEATEEAFAGGWFHSGDLCRQDEEGFIYVVDRKKDMIISGGENIYSAEVEAAIVRHEKVRDVAVIGVGHHRWGETPRAVVVPADFADPPTEEELLAHCQEQMASYKKPTSFIVLEGDLPRNAMGKVTKARLRELYGGPVEA